MARNPRVIVIGPEPVSRDEVQKMLALSGFSVLGEAGYGIEAVSLAKKTEPDVVVIAIEEPLIRALQTVEALADLLPKSPIIGHSSIKGSGSMRRAMVAGVKDYLVSPVKEEELINSIHTVMAQEERRRARLAGETDEPIAAGTVLYVIQLDADNGGLGWVNPGYDAYLDGNAYRGTQAITEWDFMFQTCGDGDGKACKQTTQYVTTSGEIRPHLPSALGKGTGACIDFNADGTCEPF